MKLFVASDIHGSAFWCEKMLDAFLSSGADRLVLLGDLLYHGPRNDLPRDYSPKQVITMLNSLTVPPLCVRGNCEAEVDAMVLDFPVMASYALISLGKRTIYATHGHLFNANEKLPLRSGDVLLHGHTHVPRCETVGGVLYLNPGSVSLPKEGSANGYMTLTEDEARWLDFDGKQTKIYKL